MVERIRWDGAHAYRDHANDRVIEPGEFIGDGAERIASAHPHDVERVTVDDDGDAGDTGGDTVESEAPGSDEQYVESPFDPGDHTVDELRDALENIPDDVTDAELEALAEAERDGDNRTSALDAIEAARE